MELIHTINSSFERGKGNFISRVKYLHENGVNSFRVSMKNFSDSEFSRVNMILTELREFSNKSLNPFVIYLDIPYPNEKYRGRCLNNTNVKKDNIILLAKESERHNLVDNEEIIIFLEDGFFSDKNLNVKNIIYGDGSGILSLYKKNKYGAYVKAMNDFVLFDNKSFSTNNIKRNNINSNIFDCLLELCNRHSIDYIMLSFCNKAIDIKEFKKKVSLKRGYYLAKIETELTNEELREIAEEADGLVIARGDLGVKIPHKDFLLYQLLISQVAKEKRKKLYFATGILDSLLSFPFPTRGDITDFANIMENSPTGLIFDSKMGYKKRIEELNKYLKIQNFI